MSISFFIYILIGFAALGLAYGAPCNSFLSGAVETEKLDPKKLRLAAAVFIIVLSVRTIWLSVFYRARTNLAGYNQDHGEN